MICTKSCQLKNVSSNFILAPNSSMLSIEYCSAHLRIATQRARAVQLQEQQVVLLVAGLLALGGRVRTARCRILVSENGGNWHFRYIFCNNVPIYLSQQILHVKAQFNAWDFHSGVKNMLSKK
jgi:hypothetical protein